MLGIDADRHRRVRGQICAHGIPSAHGAADLLGAVRPGFGDARQVPEHPQCVTCRFGRAANPERLDGPPGHPAGVGAIGADDGVGAVVDHVPACGWLKETSTSQMAELHSWYDAFAELTEGAARQPAERPRALARLGPGHVPVMPVLDARARLRQRGPRTGDNVTRCMRVSVGAEIARGNAVWFARGGRAGTDDLLAGSILGHCESIRPGPTHPAKDDRRQPKTTRESVTLVLVTGTSVGGFRLGAGRRGCRWEQR